MHLHDTLAGTELDQHQQAEVARPQPGAGPGAEEAGHADAGDAVQHPERTHAVHDHVVRVQCSRVTLFAFLLDDEQRFISFDEKPRMVTHRDALEIQGRLPVGLGQPEVSVEKVEPREM
jgi:hypothetical protein